MKSIVRAALVCALVALAATSGRASRAWADEVAVAQLKTATGAVFVVRDGKRVAAQPGDQLFEKDVLQTDADGTDRHHLH